MAHNLTVLGSKNHYAQSQNQQNDPCEALEQVSRNMLWTPHGWVLQGWGDCPPPDVV